MKGQITNVVFWILLGLLILWIVLKASGYIKSPYWIEVSPYVLIALLIYVLRGEVRKDIETTVQPLKELIDKINIRLSKQEGIIETILHLGRKRK